MKKFISAFIILAIAVSSVFALPVSAYAKGSVVTDIAQPCYEYTLSAKSELTVSGDTATCSSRITGLSGVTKITAVQYLEKKTLWWWNPVDSWEYTVNGAALEMYNSKSGLESGTYQVRTVFTVYLGTNSEEIEKCSAPQKK